MKVSLGQGEKPRDSIAGKKMEVRGLRVAGDVSVGQSMCGRVLEFSANYWVPDVGLSVGFRVGVRGSGSAGCCTKSFFTN